MPASLTSSPAGEASRSPLRRPAVFALAPFAGGLIFASLFSVPAWPLVAAGAILAAAAVILIRRPGATWLVLAALVCAGAAWFAARDDYLKRDDVYFSLDAGFRPARATVAGVVASDPEQREYGSLFYFRPETLTVGGAVTPVSGRIRVSVYENVAARYGDRLVLRGTVFRAKPATNPAGFDYRAFLWRRGATALMRVSRAGDVALRARGRGNPFIAASFAVKHKAAGVLDRAVGGNEGALLKALTLGTREEIDAAVVEEFRAAGVVHLIAISGFNVSLVAFLLFLVLRGTRLPRPWASVVVLAFLPAYAILTGLDPPVVRASVMAALVLVAGLAERDVDLYNVLAAAALLILAFNPLLVGDGSFLLSFAACFGLAAFYRPVAAFLPLLPRLLRETTAATVAAQFAVLPFQLYYFYRFTPTALISNLVMVPLASVASILALITIIAGAVWPALGNVYGGAAWLATKVLVLAGHYFSLGLAPLVKLWPSLARAPFVGPRWDLQFWLGKPSPFLLAFLTAAAALLFVKRWRARTACATAAALALGLWLAPKVHQPSDLLRVTFLDVGQADSVFVSFPDGKTMLVDAGYAGGTYDAGERVVAPFLHGRAQGRIDYLCVTHGDADHAGGAAYIVRNFDVGEVWLPDDPYGGKSLAALRKACAEAGVRATPAPARVAVGGATVEKLWPAAGNSALLTSPNNYSTVLRFTYGRFGMLLPGDIEAEVEERLAKGAGVLIADVIKVPHHGARDAASPPFAFAVNPRLAVFTTKTGAAKFPAPATRELYLRAGARLLATGENGAALVETDGRRLYARTMF